MPITVTATEGIFDAAAQRMIIPRLTDALLARYDLTGNTFMTPTIVGSLHVLPADRIYAGGNAATSIFVELKVRSVTFTTQEQRQGFVDDVHGIFDELTGGRYPKDRTFVNVTYALDGSWGIADRAWTNTELVAAIGAAT